MLRCGVVDITSDDVDTSVTPLTYVSIGINVTPQTYL
jgi:hypothetical protein